MRQYSANISGPREPYKCSCREKAGHTDTAHRAQWRGAREPPASYMHFGSRQRRQHSVTLETVIRSAGPTARPPSQHRAEFAAVVTKRNSGRVCGRRPICWALQGLENRAIRWCAGPVRLASFRCTSSTRRSPSPRTITNRLQLLLGRKAWARRAGRTLDATPQETAQQRLERASRTASRASTASSRSVICLASSPRRRPSSPVARSAAVCAASTLPPSERSIDSSLPGGVCGGGGGGTTQAHKMSGPRTSRFVHVRAERHAKRSLGRAQEGRRHTQQLCSVLRLGGDEDRKGCPAPLHDGHERCLVARTRPDPRRGRTDHGHHRAVRRRPHPTWTSHVGHNRRRGRRQRIARPRRARRCRGGHRSQRHCRRRSACRTRNRARRCRGRHASDLGRRGGHHGSRGRLRLSSRNRLGPLLPCSGNDPSTQNSRSCRRPRASYRRFCYGELYAARRGIRRCARRRPRGIVPKRRLAAAHCATAQTTIDAGPRSCGQRRA